MWVQWCAPADPPGADEDPGGDVLGADEAGLEDVDVVRAVTVAAVLLADASATPVPPAPSPAARTPVMMSRRVRPLDLETIVASSLLDCRRGSRLARRQGSACVAVLPGRRNRTLSAL
jgi:hypothetical protein